MIQARDTEPLAHGPDTAPGTNGASHEEVQGPWPHMLSILGAQGLILDHGAE